MLGKKLASLSKIRLTKPFCELAEIRIRVGRPSVCVDIYGNMETCSEAFSAGETAEVFAEICRFSVYSFQDEIKKGYVTLDGGSRVGICGTAVYKNGKIDFIKDISSLNIRIAHEKKGCADELFMRAFSDGPCSLLLLGKPFSGKTTLLRDLARRLSERHRVVIVDSRGELSGTVRGVPAFDVGLNTDVLCGAEKTEGVLMTLKTMSPEIIICDEITGGEGFAEKCALCGVKLIASAHAESISDAKKRPSLCGALSFFDCTAVIEDRGKLYEFAKTG